jgi:AraC-like DNA-binding protein
MAFAEPDARLRGLVRRVCGYQEWSSGPLRRVEPPYSGLPLIIGFGEALTVSGDRYRLEGVTSFVAGLDVAAAVTEGQGHQGGVQLDLTPLGAARILGMPLEALSRQLVRFEDLLGREAVGLSEQLALANGWGPRLRIIQDFALHRAHAHAGPPLLVASVWRRLIASSGRASIEAMADDAGVSRKHLTRQFAHWTGLPPSAYARVLRFDRAVERIKRAPDLVDWAMLAQDCGYYDQPHFNRDFRGFSGMTPSAYLAAMMPGGGVAAGGGTD